MSCGNWGSLTVFSLAGFTFFAVTPESLLDRPVCQRASSPRTSNVQYALLVWVFRLKRGVTRSAWSTSGMFQPLAVRRPEIDVAGHLPQVTYGFPLSPYALLTCECQGRSDSLRAACTIVEYILLSYLARETHFSAVTSAHTRIQNATSNSDNYPPSSRFFFKVQQWKRRRFGYQG